MMQSPSPEASGTMERSKMRAAWRRVVRAPDTGNPAGQAARSRAVGTGNLRGCTGSVRLIVNGLRMAGMYMTTVPGTPRVGVAAVITRCHGVFMS